MSVAMLKFVLVEFYGLIFMLSHTREPKVCSHTLLQNFIHVVYYCNILK